MPRSKAKALIAAATFRNATVGKYVYVVPLSITVPPNPWLKSACAHVGRGEWTDEATDAACDLDVPMQISHGWDVQHGAVDSNAVQLDQVVATRQLRSVLHLIHALNQQVTCITGRQWVRRSTEHALALDLASKQTLPPTNQQLSLAWVSKAERKRVFDDALSYELD